MYFLRRKSFKTASFYHHATYISSCKNPYKFTLPNPTVSFSYSGFCTCPMTEGKESGINEDDWKQWLKHFDEIDKQATLLSRLKSQYTCAVDKEDHENAVRLQVAIASATQNDAAGRVMSNLNKAIEEERYEDATYLRDHTGAGLVGWWAGVSQDPKDPYGQIIHIIPEHGRFVAKSYSPWQLATTKDGTPLFEIYVSANKEGIYKEQAIYLKHEAIPEESRGVPDKMYLAVNLTHLTPYASPDLWAETLRKFEVASGKDATKQKYMDMFERCRVKGKHEGYEGKHEDYVIPKVPKFFGEEKTVIRHKFAVGSIFEKAKGNLGNDFLRVPAMLDRKDYFSFFLTVDENKDQQVSNDYSLEDHRTWDHGILNFVNCIGRGMVHKKNGSDRPRLFTLSQAQNLQPLLSGLTTFNRIIVPASSDPLDGLYIGSNGFLVTEVIEIRRKFGHWPGDDGVDDLSELEPCNYVEVVKLTGDPDVPAGQVAFRAKVGEKYKLPLWTVLEQEYGAVARYKGEGRLTGFQESKWVDVELFILGEECRKEGFAIGFLYPTQDYYFMRLFKQLRLQTFEGSQ